MDGFHDTVTRRLNDYNRLALTIVEMLLLLHFGNVVYHTFHLISGREYEKIREAAEKRFDEVKEIVVGLIDIGL
jgi:cobalamin biosynthesis Co2+ chelatase CbiK